MLGTILLLGTGGKAMEHFMAILWASLAILGVLFLDSFVGFSKLLAGVSI